EIFEYLCNGINDAGADVYDIGLATTPMVYYSTARYDFKASVQITASHNAKEYNGMKISRANALPVGYDTGLKEIEEKIRSGAPTPCTQQRGKIIPFDAKMNTLLSLNNMLAILAN
ncbi:MAG TPA: hypothetical protein PLF99_08390, partial [Tenuifilaceae bacterium]|nr:hypothetical protein [Tenuifilaceae bacterium]